MKEKFFSTLAISAIVLLITLPLGGYGGHHIKFFVSLIMYMLASFYICKTSQNSKERWLRNIILISLPILAHCYAYIVAAFQQGFIETAFSWPSFFSYLIGFSAGLIIYKVSEPLKYTISVLIVIMGLWVMFSGYSYWLNKINSGTFSGSVNEKISAFSLSDDYGNTYTNQDFKGKLVVFDFWFTGCGYCFNEMPKYERLFKKYRNNKKILIYSVNKPVNKDTSGYANYLVRDLNFTFPILYASDTVAKQFKINSYPQYLALEDGNTIIYHGNLDGVEKLLKKYSENH